MRGDILGMFIFLLVLLVGMWQLVVAWKRLHGLSLTGYPDKKWLSLTLGVLIIVGDGAWYFSRPYHFNYPDVEGVETVILLVLAVVGATIIQCLLSSLIFTGRRYRDRSRSLPGEIGDLETLKSYGITLEVGDTTIPAALFPAHMNKGYSLATTTDYPSPQSDSSATTSKSPGNAALLLHEFGGDRWDLAPLAFQLSRNGVHCLPLDLDGHGENLRPLTEKTWSEPISAGLKVLREQFGAVKPVLVGWGWGGNLCLLFNKGGDIGAVVALEPLPCRAGKFQWLNCFRELIPSLALQALLRREPHGSGNKRIKPAKLLERAGWPPTSSTSYQPTIYQVDGTGCWFVGNRGRSSVYESLPAPKELLTIQGSHAVIPYTHNTLRTVLEIVTDQEL